MSSLLFTHLNACASRLRSLSKTTLLLSFVVGTHSALAAPLALTLGEAQQQAVARSRQMTAQDHASAASREMAVAAGQLPDPVLKVGVDNLPVNGRDR